MLAAPGVVPGRRRYGHPHVPDLQQRSVERNEVLGAAAGTSVFRFSISGMPDQRIEF
jgi:hypothetical protein